MLHHVSLKCINMIQHRLSLPKVLAYSLYRLDTLSPSISSIKLVNTGQWTVKSISIIYKPHWRYSSTAWRLHKVHAIYSSLLCDTFSCIYDWLLYMSFLFTDIWVSRTMGKNIFWRITCICREIANIVYMCCFCLILIMCFHEEDP